MRLGVELLPLSKIMFPSKYTEEEEAGNMNLYVKTIKHKYTLRQLNS